MVGASAGGIESLSMLLGGLTASFPVPIIIAQHLDPTHGSHIVDVLSRRSALPVRPLDEGSALERGVAYVVPPGHDAELTDEGVALVPRQHPGPTPSIDRLFRSAASRLGESLVAVLLSGAGNDGAAGARAVKQGGGAVLVEDPQTASYPSMPGSVPPALVDAASSPEGLAPLLERMVAEPGAGEGDAEAISAILDRVRERAGIDFSAYKSGTIQRRLRQRVAVTEAGGLEGYGRFLDEHPEELARLVHGLLIKVTEFMRDRELFAALGERVLPELLKRARERGEELRIWSAGCATGEEAYSIAILLCERLKDLPGGARVRVFATDIDADAITQARHGIYPTRALAGLSDEAAAKYFTQVAEDRHQVTKEVRALVVFGEHDLAQRAPFPHINLVVCRNVLIYFSSELQRRVLQIFAFALRDGGYLVLGRAETVSPLPEFFAPHAEWPKVYVRRGGRAPIPSLRAPQAGPRLPSARLVLGVQPPVVGQPLPPARAPFEALVTNLPVALVVVDRSYDIIEINLAARRLLGIHTPALGEDLIHLASALPHRPLLDLIEGAFRGTSPASIRVSEAPQQGPVPRTLEIACYPQRFDTSSPVAECVLVLVTDVTATVARLEELERVAAEEGAARVKLAGDMEALGVAHERALEEGRRLRAEVEELRGARDRSEAARLESAALIERLTETNRRLSSANDELAAAIEQLRGANEELLIRTEEAQAAHEELETLGEEFQASNEELETLNEELQATVEELSTTNAELETRNNENAALVRTAQAEREKLAATLLGIGDAFLAVDTAARPLFQNPAYAATFDHAELRDPDGEPIAPEDTPAARAARAETFRADFTIADASGALRYFEACGNPILSPGDHVGGVVVIRDITDRSVRSLQDRFLAIAGHELRTPLTLLLGYLAFLDKLPAGDVANRQRYVEKARHEVVRLARLVDDLVDVVRIRTGKLALTRKPVDLRAVVERAVDLARGGAAGVPIEVDTSELREPPVVRAEEARLEQVIINLVVNAGKHGAGTPRIDVRLRRVEEGGGQAEIVVEDQGPGIPPDALAHIFESFYQVEHPDPKSRGGMGLGLYIAREIVEAHGGSLCATSVLGQGTTMTVRLPLEGAVLAQQATEAPLRPVPGG